MTALQETKLSMLDLVTVREGGTIAEALAIARDTARHVEQIGFTRYWVAEHQVEANGVTRIPGLAISNSPAASKARSAPGEITSTR